MYPRWHAPTYANMKERNSRIEKKRVEHANQWPVWCAVLTCGISFSISINFVSLDEERESKLRSISG